MESIYVAIPSMEDTETVVTIENAILAAEHPERVHIGVSFRDLNKKEYKKALKLSSKYKNISVDFSKLKRKNLSSYGTGNGRYRSHQMYSGQDYMLQIDSHTLFEKNWDSYLINLFKECKQNTGLDKFILTSYLPYYHYSPERVKREDVWGLPRYPYLISDDFFLEYIPKWTDDPIDSTKVSDKFIPCVKFNGAFAFGNKDFIENTGLHKEAIFYEEETIQGINLIGNDCAMVFPNVTDLPLAHLYADDINEFGGKRTYFSDLLNFADSETIARKSASNYLEFINNKDNKKSIKKYEKYARMDVHRGALSNGYIPKVFIVEDNND